MNRARFSVRHLIFSLLWGASGLLIGLLIFQLAQTVLAQGGPYTMPWYGFDGGGGGSDSSGDGRFQLLGTIGQADDTAAWVSESSGQYSLGGGFLFPAASGDLYENDDTCSQAKRIAVDGLAQSHTFHQAGDADWVSFQATQGITYVIRVRVPPYSLADLNLALYGTCDSQLDQQQPSFSADIQLTFAAPADGAYHLRLSNVLADQFGAEVTYDLTVRSVQETQPGALILVAGRIKADDRLQTNIYSVTNNLYHFARSHGCGPDQIFYLAPDLTPNGDSGVQVDRLATRQNLEYALTEWAKDKVGPNKPLTLYLMDHGGVDQLHLDKPQGETITPADLDGWLDTLETAVPMTPVNVVVEACNSGSFIDPVQQVSQPGRVVIASTGAAALAYASEEGALFSDAFLNTLSQGVSLREAFQEGAWAVGQVNPFQTPWLDDDGDGVPNEAEDGLLAAQRTFACTKLPLVPLWPPDLAEVTVGAIKQNQAEIRATVTVTDTKQVSRVWAVIYPPSYVPPIAGDEIVVQPLAAFDLQNQGNDTWSGLYPQFNEPGVYRVVVYAADSDGLQSRPQEVLAQVRQVYLPLLQK